MSILNPRWRYHTAEATRKPGYLKDRMVHYRRMVESEKAKMDKVVTLIKREQKR